MSSGTFHNHPQNIGDRIREARQETDASAYGRKERGLSRAEFAEQLGVTRQAVGQWEVGTTVPDLENLVAIAIVTGQPLDWFVGRKYDAKGRLMVTLDGYAADIAAKKIKTAESQA